MCQDKSKLKVLFSLLSNTLVLLPGGQCFYNLNMYLKNWTFSEPRRSSDLLSEISYAYVYKRSRAFVMLAGQSIQS